MDNHDQKHVVTPLEKLNRLDLTHGSRLIEVRMQVNE